MSDNISIVLLSLLGWVVMTTIVDAAMQELVGRQSRASTMPQKTDAVHRHHEHISSPKYHFSRNSNEHTNKKSSHSALKRNTQTSTEGEHSIYPSAMTSERLSSNEQTKIVRKREHQNIPFVLLTHNGTYTHKTNMRIRQDATVKFGNRQHGFRNFRWPKLPGTKKFRHVFGFKRNSQKQSDKKAAKKTIDKKIHRGNQVHVALNSGFGALHQENEKQTYVKPDTNEIEPEPFPDDISPISPIGGIEPMEPIEPIAPIERIQSIDNIEPIHLQGENFEEGEEKSVIPATSPLQVNTTLPNKSTCSYRSVLKDTKNVTYPTGATKYEKVTGNFSLPTTSGKITTNSSDYGDTNRTKKVDASDSAFNESSTNKNDVKIKTSTFNKNTSITLKRHNAVVSFSRSKTPKAPIPEINSLMQPLNPGKDWTINMESSVIEPIETNLDVQKMKSMEPFTVNIEKLDKMSSLPDIPEIPHIPMQ